jgi:hypothetical protein
MKLAQHCQDAEVRLQGLESTILEFRPESLDRCQDELRKIIETLQAWVAAPEPVDDEDRQALLRVREARRRVAELAERGSKLCLGWAQLRLSSGYTNHGEPVVFEADPGPAYEG